MNGWPMLWAQPSEGFESYVSQWTDWTESGSYAGHLSGQYTFPKS
jgi:hypothetical protein